MKKILVILLTITLLLSAQVFADETTQTTAPTTPAVETQTTPEAQSTAVTGQETGTVATNAEVQPTAQPGITPDSLFYGLDKLVEKIQLSLITDSVKKAEELAKISQERLAESNAMLEKFDIELSQKALEEYKSNLEQAVTLIETAMETGKQVADVMNDINTTNISDATVVEKILSSIPAEYQVEVKTELEKISVAVDAANETAQVVENKEEQEGIKQDITSKLLEEQIKDAAVLAKIKEAGLNTRQIIALISLSEQANKPLAEVVDMFIENENGMGATAHELGLTTKAALKGINNSFKDAKTTIKKAFKEAIKAVDEEDKEEVEALVESSLNGQPAVAQAEAVNEELTKVIKEAEQQVVNIVAESDEKIINRNKEKTEEKLVKQTTKNAEKAIVIEDKHETDDNDQNVNNKPEKEKSERVEKTEKFSKKN